MGSFSMMHWMVLLVIVLILFGAGRLPRVMGDFAKGIKAFKSGMQEEETASAAPPVGTVAPPYPAQPAAVPHPAYPPQAGYVAPVQPPAAPPPVSPQTVAPAPGTAHPGTDYRTGSAA